MALCRVDSSTNDVYLGVRDKKTVLKGIEVTAKHGSRLQKSMELVLVLSVRVYRVINTRLLIHSKLINLINRQFSIDINAKTI